MLRTYVECILATRQCKSPPSRSEAEDESEEEQVYFLQCFYALRIAVRGLHHTASSVVTVVFVIKLVLTEYIAMITDVSQSRSCV